MESQNGDKKRKQVDLSSFYKAVESRGKRKEKELQKQRDKVIEELFGDGPEIGLDDHEEAQDVQAAPGLEQDVQATTSLEPASKVKKDRRWRPAWKFEHKWAYPVIAKGKLRIKCEWCAYCKHKNPYANKGATTIQLPALNEHSESDEHKVTAFKWANKEKRVCIPLSEYVATFEDKEKVRVVTIMWQMYFVVKCAGPMELFEKLCLHQIEQGVANMPRHTDYGTHLNRAVGMEFMQAIQDVLWTALCGEIQASPCYSLMVDDSTDRAKEGHLIVYISYLRDGGKGDNHVTFVKLIKTDDGGAKAKYDALLQLLKKMGLSLHKLVSLATDGCSVMIGHRGGLIAKLRAHVPHLLLVHCLAHRENLAASQAVGAFPELMHLDKLCRSIYTWLHASGKRMDDFKLIEGALDLPELAMLRIHSVRWLSRGQVMERMVKVMPALLLEFGKEKPSIYDELTIYANQFFIHMLADICSDLNILSCQFQSDLVDIANISGFADAALQNLKKKFLRDSSSCGTKYLKHFIEQTKNGSITFVDAGGETHVHSLKFSAIEGSNRGGSFENCMHLGKELVIRIVENLSERMQEDMPIFEACKLFSPKHYLSEELEHEACCKQWLQQALHQYGSLVDDVQICMGELDAFVTVLSKNFKRKSFLDAWDVCRDDITMRDSFPNLMRLWEILSVVPVNIAAAERGFSLQNNIKSAHRTSMSTTLLENYMFIGLNGPDSTSDVPWDDVFAVWRQKKKKRFINTKA
ncbi:hypothetical protein L7F22_059715 [Adiantum nelumboides]|nr:hypothetical protein [Adiantum nelumboides]